MDDACFLVQPYTAKATRLVGEAARFFADEASARHAARRLARFRAGVVVASQSFDPVSGRCRPPSALAVHGRVPAAWGLHGKAA